MSKNQVIAGESPAIPLPVPSGTRSGDPVKVGGYIGVCETDRAGDTGTYGETLGGVGHPTGYAAVAVDGVYSLKVPEVVTTVGTPIYIIAADNTLTTTSTSNTLFGHTYAVVQRGVSTGGTKAVDSGGVEGEVNVKLVRV